LKRLLHKKVRKDQADRLREERWPMIAWNYKPAERRVRDRPRRCWKDDWKPISALRCLICENEKTKTDWLINDLLFQLTKFVS
jgi:hypothetical protein